MKAFLKIGITMAAAAMLTFAAGSEKSTGANCGKVVANQKFHTIPAPPPIPGSPKVPLG